MASDKKRILVAEDEDVLRQIYEEDLKREGYEVFTARNGKEALVHLEADRPDLIILDIAMPEMTRPSAVPGRPDELGSGCLCCEVGRLNRVEE